MQNLLFIFFNFFKIALFVVGGGFAMIPVIEDTFVKQKKILSEEDMLDMIAITQTLPGMTAVNAAIFVGHKIAGFKGAFAAVLGVILPSIIIITTLAMLLQASDIKNPHWLKAFSCVRACVTAIFCMMACRIAKRVYDCRNLKADEKTEKIAELKAKFPMNVLVINEAEILKILGSVDVHAVEKIACLFSEQNIRIILV